jgi:hypothetical protein
MGMEVSGHEIHETWKNLLRYWVYIGYMKIWRGVYEGYNPPTSQKPLLNTAYRCGQVWLALSLRDIFRIPEVQHLGICEVWKEPTSLGKKKGIE